MATIGSAKAGLIDKIDSLRAASGTTAKDMIFLAKALKENTTHHSFTFQGAWAASTAYALDDVVTTSGKTYICILGYTSGSSFAVGSNWSLMAEKGTDGTTVGTGTAGQVLKTNSAGTGTEWGADEGGKLLQLVSTSSSSSLYPDASWRTMPAGSLSITPLAVGSKFLISYSSPGAVNNLAAQCYLRLQIGGASIWESGRYGESNGGNWGASPFIVNAVHTGASYTVGTPITYVVGGYEGAGAMEVNITGDNSATMQIMEIGA